MNHASVVLVWLAVFASADDNKVVTFDPTTNRTKSPEHVQVRVAEGWAGLTVFGYEVYGNLTQRLESEGFVRDVDILPMGYDWRLSVADWEQEAFPRFFRTISDAVSKNVSRLC